MDASTLAARADEVGRALAAERDPRAIVRRLGESGLLGHCVPAPFGAHDRVVLSSLCAIRDALAYHSSLADTMFAMQGLGSYPVTLAGSGEQRRQLLPRVADGAAICAFAITEPDAGSDISAIATTARRDGDDYVLDGHKTFISNAGIADSYVLFARTAPAGETRRTLSAFLVEGSARGLATRPIELIAEHPIGELLLDGVRVPASARLGAEGDGASIALGTLDRFRASVGAAANGMARRALDEAIARVKVRRQFGKLLAEQQATQLAIAEMAVELDAARLLVERAARLGDDGARVTREAAMAKLYATEAAQRVIDRALQLHGGLGVVRGQIVEELYREVRALRIYEGTSEIQKLVIARELLK